MKNYTLIFEDIQGNELKRQGITAFNKKEAKQIASDIRAESMINGLHKIVVL